MSVDKPSFSQEFTLKTPYPRETRGGEDRELAPHSPWRPRGQWRKSSWNRDTQRAPARWRHTHCPGVRGTCLDPHPCRPLVLRVESEEGLVPSQEV